MALKLVQSMLEYLRKELTRFRILRYNVRTKLYRKFPFLYERLFLLIDRNGIWWYHKGDEVLWIYPWRRRGYKYVSLMCEGCFQSIDELDKFWDEYFKEMKKGATNV